MGELEDAFGPGQVLEPVLAQVLDRGAAGKGVLICDPSLAGADAATTAKVLAAAIRKVGFDLVIAGVESTDGSTGVVPQMVAASVLGMSGLACLSFNGNKLLTTGGGGMVVTNDEQIAKRAQYLSTQAKDDPIRYVHEEIGFNYRLTNVQAAIGVAQMERIDMFLQTKRAIAERYGLQKSVAPVRGMRALRKRDMVHNDYVPAMEIDPETYEVRADGMLLTCEAAQVLPMAQRYFLF